MGRAPCCDKANVKKGPWSPEEDGKLKAYIQKHGTAGNWIALPQKLGLRRCGKSCRLRWLNYLRPNIKHGEFSDEEDRIICSLFASIGSRWSIMAAQLPGRTDNDIKNYWNTKLKKKLMTITTTTTASTTNNYHNYNITPIFSTNYQTTPHQLTMRPAPPNHNSSISNSPFHLPEEPYAAPPANFTALMVSQGSIDVDDNLLGFGSEQHDRENLCYFGGFGDDHKFLFGGSSTAEMNGCGSGVVGDPMDYGIEEIKQLIGTSNSLMSFFVDETVKTEGVGL